MAESTEIHCLDRERDGANDSLATACGGWLAFRSDQQELDLTLDYRFQSRALSRLWLRARTATLDQDDDTPGAIDVDDFRIIVNYEWSIL